MSDQLLSGIRVVELATEIAGPYCSKLLADAGADVVKVEPPHGDPLRGWSASGVDLGERAGALFRYLSASKRSIVAGDDDVLATVGDAGDAGDAGGVDGDGDRRVAALFAGAHLVIESGQLAGTDVVALRRRHPHLSVVSITPFGKTSPWAEMPATEFTLQALCGSMAGRGGTDREPLHAGGRLGEWIAGVYAGVAAAALIRGWRTSGHGDHADVSMLECMTVTMGGFSALQRSLGGPVPEPPSRSLETPSIEPTSDGYVGFCTVTAQQFADFLVLIERADLLDDAHLASFAGRKERRDDFLELVHRWTTQHPTDEIVGKATLLRVPVAPIGRPDTVMEVDQFVERGVFVPNGDGDFRQPRAPFLVDGQPAPTPGRAPGLGEHDDRIDWEPVVQHGRASPAAPGPPLAGVRVVDLTAFWAGPSATQVLAALGADVIKVESTQRPDGMRFSAARPPTEPAWWETGIYYLANNMNKRDLTLDLSSERGRQLLLRLIEESDVLIENFSPRVLDGFGLTRQALEEANPRLVVARMPAFGLSGPWRDRTGFAQTMEQAAGMAWMTGFADGPPVIPRGPCDPLAGMHAVFAVIAAIDHRDRRGGDGSASLGHHLECTMVEAALNVAAEMAIEHDAYGVSLCRDGNRGPVAAPQGVYRCGGDETWVAVAITDDHQWRHLTEVMGEAGWARDDRLATPKGRREHADEIDRQLQTWLRDRDRDEVIEQLVKSGIPAAPMVEAADVTTLPHLLARGFVEHFQHPVVGEHDVVGVPFRLSSHDGPWFHGAAPTLGQHNDEILHAMLGLSSDEIAALRADGVVGERPSGVGA